MFRSHCPDHELLAALDGELSGWTALRVRAHLRACWACRRRQAEMERQVHALMAAADAPALHDPEWLEQSKRRFRAWAGTEPPGPPPRAHRPQARPFLFAGAAALAVVLVVAVAVTRQPLQPRRVLAAVQRYERNVASGPYVQDVVVEMVQLRPTPLRRTSELEVRSDRASGRHALRWRRQSETRYAALRTGARQQVIRSVGWRDSDVPRRLVEIGCDEPDVDELERNFLRWLDGRRWEPVQFGTEMALLAEEEGVVATAERVSHGPDRLVRVLVRKAGRRLIATALLEVEERTFRPRLQEITFQTPQRSVVVRLTPRRSEAVERASLSQALFEPERLPAPNVLPPPLAGSPNPVRESASLSFQADTVQHRIESAYAEHQAGLCLGPIPPARTRAAASTMPALGTTLQQWYRERFGESQGDRHLAEFVEEASGSAARLLAHLQAAEHLMRQFPSDAIEEAGRSPLWLLDRMVGDHLTEAAVTAGHLRGTLAPVFQATGQAAPATVVLPDQQADCCGELVLSADRLNELLQASLVAGNAQAEPAEISRQIRTVVISLEHTARLRAAVPLGESRRRAQLATGRR